MQFSTPEYPLFLIAVFFLYALARWGGPAMAWARICVMVLLGDAVFALVAKDPDVLWDPIGGGLLRLVAGAGPAASGFDTLAVHWAIGGAVLLAALATGRRAAGWIASDAGQAWIARGLAAALAAVGATVVLAWRADALDPTT